MTHANRPGFAGLLQAWQALALRDGFRLTEVRTDEPDRSLWYADLHREHAQSIFIAAGVHGDEPVSPWALLAVVRDGLLDPRYAYRLWFCTNPTGYDLGTRSNSDGADINRSYTGAGLTPEARALMRITAGESYVLALDLHEDFESEGFYLYEPIVGQIAPYGREIIAAIVEAGYALQALDEAFDLGYPCHEGGYQHDAAAAMALLEPGRVLPDIARECEYFADGLPLTMFLLNNGSKRSLTFETPRRAPWDDRIAMHRIAVTAAIAQIERIEGNA